MTAGTKQQIRQFDRISYESPDMRSDKREIGTVQDVTPGQLFVTRDGPKGTLDILNRSKVEIAILPRPTKPPKREKSPKR